MTPSGAPCARDPSRRSDARRLPRQPIRGRRALVVDVAWFHRHRASGKLDSSFMVSDTRTLGERVFMSADVARLASVSLRQLQWWDERKVISPRKDDHRRVYTPEQVLEILTVAALRRKGLSFQKVRKVLRLLRRELGHLGNKVWSTQPKLYLITDGNSILVDDEAETVLNQIADATKSMYLVCLTDQAGRINSEQAPRRYRTKQLPLFR